MTQLSVSFSFAAWILPRILLVPTPTAVPANLMSTSFMSPTVSQKCFEMIVLCAPLSTKAWNLTLLISISM